MAIPPSLRWEVFRRDGFRCVYCGQAAEDGAVLEVDHVVPRAVGGEDTLSNLQTACQRCNGGKSDRQPDGHRLRRRSGTIRQAKGHKQMPPPRPDAPFCWTPLAIAAMAYFFDRSYAAQARAIVAAGYPRPPGTGESWVEYIASDPAEQTRWISDTLGELLDPVA